VLLLSKLEETLVVDGTPIDLATNEYAGAIHPRGFELQTGFRLDPWPVFTFDVAGTRVEKSVFMVHGGNTTVITYRVLSAASSRVTLELRPLIAFREYHSLMHENGAIDKDVMASPNLLSIAADRGLPPLYLAHNADEVEDQGFWYRNFIYRVERERGLDHAEDLFNPVVLRFDLQEGETAAVIASTDAHDIASVPELESNERHRRTQVAARAPINDDLVRTLTVAADQYIVRRTH
jgi:predicted glycogen debranching enzyme